MRSLFGEVVGGGLTGGVTAKGSRKAWHIACFAIHIGYRTFILRKGGAPLEKWGEGGAKRVTREVKGLTQRPSVSTLSSQRTRSALSFGKAFRRINAFRGSEVRGRMILSTVVKHVDVE